MKLIKDTLIEGEVYKKGAEYSIREALKKFRRPIGLGPSLSIIGFGMNPNGNHVVKVELPGGKKTSIQTNNPLLSYIHSVLKGKPSEVESYTDWEQVKYEVEAYISNYL